MTPVVAQTPKRPSRVSSVRRPHYTGDTKMIAKGAVVNFLGILAGAMRPLFTIVVARLFGSATFGFLMIGWSAIEFLSKVGIAGLDKGVIKFISQRKESGDRHLVRQTVGDAVVTGLLVSSVVAAIGFALAPFIANEILDKPIIGPYLRVMMAALPLMTISAIFLGAVKSFKVMKFDIYVKSFAEPIVLVSASVLVYWLGFGLGGLALAQVAAVAAGLAVAWWGVCKIVGRQPGDAPTTIGRWRPGMLGFSLPISVSDMTYTLATRLDVFIMAVVLTEQHVALYAAAFQFAVLIRRVKQSFDPIFTPIVSDLATSGQTDRLERSYSLVMRWVLALGLPVFAAISLLGRDLLELYGTEFVPAASALTVLAAGYLINGAFGPTDTLLIMSGRQRLNMVNTIAFTALLAVSQLLVIPRWGVFGAAVSVATSLTLLNVVRFAQVYFLLRIQPFRRAFVKPLAAGGIAWLTVVIVASVTPTGGVVTSLWHLGLFLISYAALLAAFGSEPEESAIIEASRSRLARIVRIAWPGGG